MRMEHTVKKSMKHGRAMTIKEKKNQGRRGKGNKISCEKKGHEMKRKLQKNKGYKVSERAAMISGLNK